MIVPSSGVRVWLATGATDMRRGMNSLALQLSRALEIFERLGTLIEPDTVRDDLAQLPRP